LSTIPREIFQNSHSAVTPVNDSGSMTPLITPRTDQTMALAVRQLAARQAGVRYLLEPEISVLLARGFTDLRRRMFFDVLWNTGARLSEALALTPRDIHTGEVWPLRPFVSLMTLKQQGRPGRPPSSSVRDVPLFDPGFVLRLRDHLATFARAGTRRVWAVTDDTARHWLRDAVTRCESLGLRFSVPVTPHTFRHSFAVHLVYCGMPPLQLKALLGHRDFKSTQVYLKLLALEAEIGGHRAVRFGLDAGEAERMMRSSLFKLDNNN
jgi:integrase